MKSLSTKEQDVRKFIRGKLALKHFQPKPLNFAYILLPILSVIFLWYIVLINEMVWIKLISSLLLGIAHASLGFFGHEVMHGSMVKSKVLRYLAMWCGTYIHLFGPTLWRKWHNHIHHAYAMSEKDTDRYFLKSEIDAASPAEKPLVLYFSKSGPGAGTMLSMFALFQTFFISAHAVLWAKSKYLGWNKSVINIMKLEVLVQVLLWLIIFSQAGMVNGMFLLVIPSLTAGCFLMLFIFTNHHLCPMSAENDSLKNSMSVNTWKLFDLIFFNFSLHVEHHLFPSMHWSEKKKVQEILREYYPDDYMCFDHFAVLKKLYSTPRIYKDKLTLMSLDGSQVIAISSVIEDLKKSYHGDLCHVPNVLKSL